MDKMLPVNKVLLLLYFILQEIHTCVHAIEIIETCQPGFIGISQAASAKGVPAVSV